MKPLFRPGFAAAITLVLLATSSCRHADQVPVAVIVVCDLSASIEPEARTSCFESVELVVRRLRRGDSVIVIPVTSDTETEAAGRVLRFEASAQREVFDEDLIRLSREARAQLERLAAAAKAAPSAYTNLLGAIRLASEEIRALPQNQRVALVVLSDFIEDTPRLDFKHDPALARKKSAKALAAELAIRNPVPLKGAVAYLGFLRSRDLVHLGQERRNAIREFWQEYLVRLGAQPEIASDGPGLLRRFLDRACGSTPPRGFIG